MYFNGMIGAYANFMTRLDLSETTPNAVSIYTG